MIRSAQKFRVAVMTTGARRRLGSSIETTLSMFIALMCLPSAASGQGTTQSAPKVESVCWRARPLTECRSWVITEMAYE
jgi:hypothetical protein